MLSTSTNTRGGISAVINTYFASGLFERWPIRHIATHEDGGTTHKLKVALHGFMKFFMLLVSGRVSLVHVHAASNASFWRKTAFILLAKLAGKPVIFHLHGGGFTSFYARQNVPGARRLLRWVLDHAAEIVVLSEEWKQKIADITGNLNIIVMHNPVSHDLLPPVDRTERQQAVVLFVGRLERDKGVFDLLAAIARLRSRFPAVRLWLAGAGDVEAVNRCARELGVAHAMELLGWITGPQKRRAFAAASVFALPSYTEGLPVALLEAMGARLPVVATDVGGIPSVVTQHANGLLVKPGDIGALADALATVLGDPLLRERMGRQSRERIVRDFSAHKVVGQLEALYRRHGICPRNMPAEGSANPWRN